MRRLGLVLAITLLGCGAEPRVPSDAPAVDAPALESAADGPRTEVDADARDVGADRPADVVPARADVVPCGGPCPGAPHATGACDGTTCTTTCDPGYGDCDGNAANGCEVNLSVGVVMPGLGLTADCGACGTTCTRDANESDNVCARGVCNPVCQSGYRNCNGNLGDGCEASLQTDSNNCGSCGHFCSSGRCARGTCG